MWRLERVWEEGNRTPVLLASGAIIAIVALADWWTKPFVAFGVLYLFPIMLAAAFLPRWVIGAACAVLSELFSSLERSNVRLAFETLALAGCGLFVAELMRNRRLTLEGQERLKALVETSPAAIVTLGLLPAALSHAIGSDSQRPFAIVIVGGLISGLLLSIFLLPTLYAWIARAGDVLPVPEASLGESH
jgi:hypothetical protein